MASFNFNPPPRTKNPEELCSYMYELYDMLCFVLQNIDNDNLCEDLESRLKRLEKAVFGEEEK